MCELQSNLAGIYHIHDGFLSKDFQHMVFQIQHRAQEPQYVFVHITNNSFKFLLSEIWPTEPQILLVDVTSIHTALILTESKREWM